MAELLGCGCGGVHGESWMGRRGDAPADVVGNEEAELAGSALGFGEVQPPEVADHQAPMARFLIVAVQLELPYHQQLLDHR